MRKLQSVFQSFEAPTRAAASGRLADLRKAMTELGLDWYLLPHGDEYQNEYLPPCAERLAFLTGFTGSAGFAIIGHEDAFLFVDGRYTLQAASQADGRDFEIRDLVNEPPSRFAAGILENGNTVGFDPWTMTMGQTKSWEETCTKAGAELQRVRNLVDQIWQDRPPAPLGRAWLHPERFAGKLPEDKLAVLAGKLKEAGADCLLQTDPASIAWTFNLRGSDVAHNPLALAFAILFADGRKPVIFIDRRKLDDETETGLEGLAELRKPSELESWLAENAKDRKFHCDPQLVSAALAECIASAGGTVIEGQDPVALPRATKNEAELSGAREAHLRDGVAMVRFLAWLDRQQAGSVDEITAARQLEGLRRETAVAMNSELKEISFDTISGAGAHGAIIHYRVTEESNTSLEANSLYLVDSGGQYEDGTTDITRTIAIGTPPGGAARDYTLVLKGHIAIAMARFPAGTRGVDLDSHARLPLWQAGKDFAHGTGHGIGAYLNVHEGPQSISKRGMQELLPGMILSNEPGYYREGHYGIRLENLVIVDEAPEIEGGDKPMLGFETITLCPFDRRLVETGLLSPAETAWLNAYHARVREALTPHLDKQDADWLKSATKKL
ncbi:MAG: aminopeptidase P family protein [Nitratireductor sp.]|nr:aminopeptidase P family protein [Nitratireductor sp.]